MPGLSQHAPIEMHAQAGSEEGLLDVVRGQGVAGQEHVHIAHADDLFEEFAAAGVDHGGTGDNRRAPPAARFSASCRAIWRMATFLGFSVETLLPMNSKVCGPRDRSSGKTRTPAWLTTMRSPTLTSAIARQRAVAMRIAWLHLDHNPAVHFLIGDLQPTASHANFGPLVGSAVEVLGKGPGNVGRHQAAIADVGRRAP